MNTIEVLEENIKTLEHEIDALDLQESDMKFEGLDCHEIRANIGGKIAELEMMYSQLKEVKRKK